MLNRRTFIQSSGVAALASSVPLFLSKSVHGVEKDKHPPVLVVIELDGGNDALNTVVPHTDENYAKLRPNLKQNPKNLLKVTDTVGLHPLLYGFKDLLEANQLAVIPGVGYPNPNRSHFESMAIWHSGKLSTEDRRGYGWLGQAFDKDESPLFSIGSSVSPSLRGRRSSAVSFTRLEDVLLTEATLSAKTSPEPLSDSLLDFVRKQDILAQSTASNLAKIKKGSSEVTYSNTGLGSKLKLVANLLKADLGVRVFYTQQSGFDTHSNQQFTHGNLLGDLSQAVSTFHKDLKNAKLWDRVTLLIFSEFGRTIAENASTGTDHGTAGAVFVAGTRIRGGLCGTLPSLTDLDHGEPKSTTDFRSIYADLLENGMQFPVGDWAKGIKPTKLFG